MYIENKAKKDFYENLAEFLDMEKTQWEAHLGEGADKEKKEYVTSRLQEIEQMTTSVRKKRISFSIRYYKSVLPNARTEQRKIEIMALLSALRKQLEGIS